MPWLKREYEDEDDHDEEPQRNPQPYYRRNIFDEDLEYLKQQVELGDPDAIYELIGPPNSGLAKLHQLNLERVEIGEQPKLLNSYFRAMMGYMAAIITGIPCFRYTYYRDPTQNAVKKCKEQGLDVSDLPMNFYYNADIRGTYRGLYYRIAKQTGLGHLSWRVLVHDNPNQWGPGSVFIDMANSIYGTFQRITLHGSDAPCETPKVTLEESWLYDPIAFLDFFADMFYYWKKCRTNT